MSLEAGGPLAWIRALVLGCALLAARAGLPAVGAEPTGAAPEGPVETIEVHGEAGEATPLDPTAFGTRLRAEDFADRVTTVAELLRQTVGVQVRSLGGEFATVSIRGSSAEQVVVYLDGVPLNRALGGGVNLADLPLAQVESIEIYRGFTPAALPAASIGGAILIRTRQGQGKAARSIAATYGSFGSAEAVVSLSGGRRRADYALGLDASTSRGDFRFTDDNATPANTADDSVSPRVNNDFHQGHLSGRWSVPTGRRGRLRVATDLFARRQGVPGIDANQSRTARLDTSRALLRMDWEEPGLLNGLLLLRGALDATRYTEAFDDARGEVGFSAQRTDNRIDSLGQELGAVLVAGRRQAISFLASHRGESADLRDRVLHPPDQGTARRDTDVVTVEDQISLGGGRVVLNPSLRHEWYDSSFRTGPSTGLIPPSLDTRARHTTGKIGFRARAGAALTVKGNFGRFVRLPDFTDLFGDRGSVLGNPALSPERGRSLDLGLCAALPTGPIVRQASLEGTVFETLADDLILFVQNSQSTIVARNFGRARVRGVELTFSLALGPRLTGSLNATHQRAVNESGDPTDGRLLPGRPADEISAAAGLALGRGRVFYEFTYVGRNFVDRANTSSRALEARYLHDLGYRLRLARGLQMTVEAGNLTDDRTYDVAGFPLPGRSLHGRLTWDF
ncbi:MAG TPA: TonB-dependent receptor [Candidatus Polarisedimenticolia bacterium]|nr:TonB-dependent receptor [Candidatus Polarisedimenticolia bacterium]